MSVRHSWDKLPKVSEDICTIFAEHMGLINGVYVTVCHIHPKAERVKQHPSCPQCERDITW